MTGKATGRPREPQGAAQAMDGARRRRAALLTVAVILAAGAAASQPGPAGDGGDVLRTLDAQFQVALIRERRLADNRELRILTAGEARLKQAHAALAAARGDARQARAELRAARDAFARQVEQIAQRDAEIQAQTRAYRQQVEDLTRTADPELAAAVNAYADGDRVAAFPVIERVLLAQNRAAEAGVAARNAERLRQIATFTLDMAERGEKTRLDAINAWLAAQQLAPTAEAWLTLVQLQVDAGDLAAAESAARSALTLAEDDLTRGRATFELGVVQARAGDLQQALATYQKALEIVRPLAAGSDVAKFLLGGIYDNLALVEDLSGDAERSAFYRGELTRLRNAAWRTWAASHRDPLLVGAQEEAEAAIGRKAWPTAEAAATRALALVRHSQAWRDGDGPSRARLEIETLTLLARVRVGAFQAGPSVAGAETAHAALVELAAARRTAASQHRLVGDNYDAVTDALLGVSAFDISISRLDEARAYAEEAIGGLDGRGAEQGQDNYAKLKLVQALMLSARASVELASAAADPAAKAAAAAQARPPIDRALGMVRTFERRFGRLEIAERAEQTLLQLSARAFFHAGDRAGAVRDQETALEIATRLSSKHPANSELRDAYWYALWARAMVADTPAAWTSAAQVLLPQGPTMAPQWASVLSSIRAHVEPAASQTPGR
ncbi:MAG TPA: hypothetical protein VG939_06545 [Caulobacteraceae bacterium]|nr:hypothetical protein [Caulobacteraceae bacterium]